MTQHKDTKGTVFIVLSVIAIAVTAGIVFLAIYQQNTSSQQAAKEYACTLQYTRASTEWQACMNG